MDDLIDLIGAVDGILQVQAEADGHYFSMTAGRRFTDNEAAAIRRAVLKAYRWQYIVSGVQDPRFMGILDELTTRAQMERIVTALAPLLEAGSPSSEARMAAAA